MSRLNGIEDVRRWVENYRLKAVSSIKRNSHMNELPKESELKQETVDAVLVDFLNYIAANQGIDYGLYTADIKNK